jgi:hypothetical protein
MHAYTPQGSGIVNHHLCQGEVFIRAALALLALRLSNTLDLTPEPNQKLELSTFFAPMPIKPYMMQVKGIKH